MRKPRISKKNSTTPRSPLGLRVGNKRVTPSPHLINLSKKEEDTITPSSIESEVRLVAFQDAVRQRIHSGWRDFHERVSAALSRQRERIQEVRMKNNRAVSSVVPPSISEEEPLEPRKPFFASLKQGAQSLYKRPIAGGNRTVLGFAVMLLVLTFPIAVLMVEARLTMTEDLLRVETLGSMEEIKNVRDALGRGKFLQASEGVRALRVHMATMRSILAEWGVITYLYPKTRIASRALEQAEELADSSAATLALLGSRPLDQTTLDHLSESFARTTPLLDELGRLPEFQKNMTLFYSALSFWSKVAVVTKDFLGSPEKRYLLVFQNDDELRATGGFMGSFALMSHQRSGITIDMPPEGTYAVQGWLPNRILAPEPLRLINSRFEFQDTNWFPDFTVSAPKILSWYQASGGPTVDGVIAVNASVLEDMLRLTGPLTVPGLEGEVNASNVVEVVERTIRSHQYDARPKESLVALLKTVVDRIGTGKVKGLDGMMTLISALDEKKIQLYARDRSVEDSIRQLGWAGTMNTSTKDFVMMVQSNIGGGKTDRVIEQDITHETRILASGEMVSTVSIHRVHRGSKGDPLHGVRNVSYMRLYVPQGATLIAASGFSPLPEWRFESPPPDLTPDPDVRRAELTEKIDPSSGTSIYEEDNKTVFGNWALLDPGQESVISFTFRLPFRVSKGRPFLYHTTLLKQAGRNDPWKSIVRLDEGTIRDLHSPSASEPSLTMFDGSLAKDTVLAALIER